MSKIFNWLFPPPSIFHNVERLLVEKDYHTALENLFLISPDENKVHDWIALFRKIYPYCLSHVVAYRLGLAFQSELNKPTHQQDCLFNWFMVLNLTLCSHSYMNRDDLVTIWDFMQDKAGNIRVNNPQTAFSFAHLMKANRVANPFPPHNVSSYHLVLEYLDVVTYPD